MYHADTLSRSIYEYTLADADNSIEATRVSLSFAREQGAPDGMSIDAKGNLWVALIGGGAIACCDPHSGDVLQRVELPVTQPTSCTFGGTDYDILYITTARSGLSEEGQRAQPHAGKLLALRPGVTGSPPSRYLPSVDS
jgi:sugar lactone lactonase YvrE